MLKRRKMTTPTIVQEHVTMVSYLLSHSEEYIDTGYIPDGTEVISCTFQGTKLNAKYNQGLYGTDKICLSWIQGYQSLLGFYATSETRLDGANYYNKAMVEVDCTGLTVSGYTSVNKALNGSVPASTKPLYLLKSNGRSGYNWNAIEPFYGKFYGLTITKNGSVIHDYKPAVNDVGVGCVYDAVTGRVYYNAGTGAFEWGDE